jgi:hypothetical protein
MKSIIEDPSKKMKDVDRDNATTGFPNSEKATAAEVNRAGDAKSRHYMNKEGEDPQGPNWNKMSKDSDGDTGVNAGIFR